MFMIKIHNMSNVSLERWGLSNSSYVVTVKLDIGKYIMFLRHARIYIK